MKKITFKWLSGFLLSFCLIPFMPTYAQCLPSIGAASNFALFTSSGAIDNVQTSTIDGSIGTNVGTVTGFETSAVLGTIHVADASTNSASIDLAVAYTAFQNLTPTVTTHAPAYGSGETLFAGIYHNSGAGSIAGTLLLDAQNDPSAKFVFQFGGAFTLGAGVNIVLINGAQANSVYWLVEGAFSMATTTVFAGTVISNGAISIGVGAQIHGKLLSITGAVSTYGTELSTEGITNISNLYYADTDLDGFGDVSTATCYYSPGLVTNASDCNDSNVAIHPDAIEIYGNGMDDDCNGTIDTDTSVCDGSTTWNGSVWSNGLPSYAKEVIFDSPFTTTIDLYACSIHVRNNAVVIASHDVFVYGSVTVDNGSSYTQMDGTNLIQIHPLAINLGNITVHRSTSLLVRLDHTLWSSPVEGQAVYAFSPATLTHRFYTYDTSTDTYLSSTLTNASVFDVAKGFAVRAPNDQSATVAAHWLGSFFGVPHNGTHTYNLDYSGNYTYNLVGNPYPSTIDAASFVMANTDNIEGTLYFYAHTLSMDANGLFQSGTNYATWNATGGTAATEIAVNDPAYHTPAEVPNGSIQVGQGFFVKAKSSGTIEFTNALRTNSQDTQFFRTNQEKHNIWLHLKTNNGIAINQILIGYVTGATNNKDSSFDGTTFGTTGSYLYSIIGNESFVIQGRALPFSVTDEVPLGFVCSSAGAYSIALQDFNGVFATNQAVYIKDQQTGLTHLISAEPFVFTSSEGVFNNRFVVVYQPSLRVDYPLSDATTIRLSTQNNSINITSNSSLLEKIFVYNVLGQLIYSQSDIHQLSIPLPYLEQNKQALLFKVYTSNNEWITLKTIY